jgi:hypothetical protein
MIGKTAEGGPFDAQKMAKIIFTLKEAYKDDALIRGMIKHLIRDESDYLIPSRKSDGVVKLEKKLGLRLAGLPRKKVWTKNPGMSSNIIIEHGLPIAQALDSCLKAKSQKDIKDILEELKGSLVYITKDEHAKLNKKGFAKKREKDARGSWTGAAYAECGIVLTENN